MLSRPSVSFARLLPVISTAAVAWASLVFGPEPSLQRPYIESISISGDTVWFCGHVDPHHAASSFMWLRQSKIWRRVGADVKAPCTEARTRWDEHDTMSVGSGLIVIRVQPAPDSDGNRSGRSYLELHDAASGRTIVLKPHLDSSRVRALVDPNYDLSPDTVNTHVTAWVVDDTIAWLGLAGGFAEGDGDLGGIYRVDRRTGAYELILDERFAETTVTGMASVGSWLWVGTESPAEYGPYGDVGLLRMDHRTRAWRAYTDSSSPLQDRLIRELASDGRILAIATERGVAIAELRSPPAAANRTGAEQNGDDAIARWDVRWFVPAFVGDSMVFDPGMKEQAPPADSEAPFIVVQRFARVGHELPLYTAVAKLPPERQTKAAFDDVERAGEALADTSMISALVSMLSVQGDGQLVGAFALGKLGARAPKEAIDAVRRAFVALDSGPRAAVRPEWNRPRLGRALTMMGDSTPTRWARSALESAVRFTGAAPNRSIPDRDRNLDIMSATQILSASRDRLGLSLIIGVVPMAADFTKPTIARELAAYDTPQALGALIAFGRSKQLPANYVFDALQASSVFDDPTVGARLRDYIRESLAAFDGHSPGRATLAVERLRLIDFAPTLVQRLEPGRITEKHVAEWTSHALVSLSGRADAPVYADSLPPRSVFEWWQQWLASTNGKLVAVPRDVGRKALVDWSKRFYAINKAR